MSDFRVEITDLIRPSNPSPDVWWEIDQFSDVSVKEILNGQREASVTISMHSQYAGSIGAYTDALRIYYRNQPQPIFWAPFTYEEDFTDDTITLKAVDAIRLQHHYLRFGDAALNLPDPDGKGALTVDYYGLSVLLEAAQNTESQDTRDVPSLGIEPGGVSSARSSKIGVERGMEVWDCMQRLAEHRVGADFELKPVDDEPGAYMLMIPYNKRGSDRTATVRWYHGVAGQPDNLRGIQARPLLPITHAHVIDRNVKYRVTAADTGESYLRGIFVAWLPTDFTVEDDDTTALMMLAQATVDAYSSAPKTIDIDLRPDAAQTQFYQEHFWVGDKIYVQATKGNRTLSGNYRIRECTVSESGSRGLAQTSVTLVPDLTVSDVGEES